MRRGILELIVRPSLVGGAYVLGLAVLAGRTDVGGEDLGEHAREITSFVEGRFAGEIAHVATALGAFAFAVGMVLGTVAGLLVALRARTARRPLASWQGRTWQTLLVTFALHLFFFLRAMARTPQLFANDFYARGGARRTLEVLVTDVLGSRGITALFALALVVYLAGPVVAWRRWPTRLARAFAIPRFRGKHALAAALGVVVGVGVVTLFGFLGDRREVARVHRAAERAQAVTGVRRPNVLILAADSLRADRLDPRVAPRLSALADRGTRFDRAYVSLPRTFPSWVTILTGRHPHHHGVRSMFPRWEERAKDFDALPERLARAGYRTSVVSDYAGDIFGRIDLGFHDVDTPTFDFRQLVRQRAVERETPLLPFLQSSVGRSVFPVMRELNDGADPELLADDAIAALRRDAREGPFFLTVFFSTAHFPYSAPEPFYRRFTEPAYRGRFKYDRPVGLGKDGPPDASDIAQVRGLYDGAVSSIDAAASRILDELGRLGLADDTVVVLLADHGETLFDHGHGAGHGDHLFGDEGTHIPFVVIDPRKTGGKRVASLARDVDLAPTLYELTAVAPPADLDGRSLVPALDGAPLTPALAYAETGLWFTEDIQALPADLRLPYPDIAHMTEIDTAHGDELVLAGEVRPLTIVAKHRMVRDDHYKLIYAPTRGGPRWLLFDVLQDPAEEHDVAAAHPDEVARLRGALTEWMLRDPAMAMRNGFLLPKDASAIAAPLPTAALRMP